MGIRIEYTGNSPALMRGVSNANQILPSSHLKTIIRSRSVKFFNTQRTCADIGQLIHDCDAIIKINMFSKRPNFFTGSMTTAYVKPSIPDIIHYNTHALKRSEKAITNTLVHESVHVVDRFHDRVGGFDFTHDGQKPNHPPENRDSAPYWIGNRAEDLVMLLDGLKDLKSVDGNLDTFDIETIRAAMTDENWASKEGLVCSTP